MITVTVLINGHPVATRTCVNTAKKIGKSTVYRNDDGTNILHIRDEGFIALAHKMLDTIKEYK